MNAICARCKKTVYPVDKLNVLDKIWHKGCFTCETCGVTLSLKTYKGYNKLPYCNTHYPTTKFTAVADTPENMRLKKQTDNLSLINYHKTYNESMKGTKMSVADDPETMRAKKSQQQTSQIQYQGKDRTNPATTPLSRPAFSAPGYDIVHGQNGKDGPTGVDAVSHVPPRSPSPSTDDEAAQPAPPVPAPLAAPEPELPEPVSPLPETPTQAVIEDPIRPNTVESDEEAPAAPEEPTPPNPTSLDPNATCYVALYDYDAADDDEITIQEGDKIVNGEIVGEGWMQGTNARTGLHGMLPSNYVEIPSQQGC